jgi:hypothetical protein
VDERRREEPGRRVEVWAFDEHRLGLKPILRRQWAPKGQRPVAVGHPRYEWLSLHGFVHPGTGEVVWFVCSTVDATLLGAVLAGFAAAVGAGEDKLIILVLDNAGWHVSGDLVVPKGIELAFLPSYTRSCSRPSTCGRWRTRRSRTSTSRRSRTSTRRSASAAARSPPRPRPSRPRPTSAGGRPPFRPTPLQADQPDSVLRRASNGSAT